jgi:hypothetical protein
MTDTSTKTRKTDLDLEPTYEEIADRAALKHFLGEAVVETLSDWVDLCCMVENQMRRNRGII